MAKAGHRHLESAKRDREARDYARACFKAEQRDQFALKALLRGLGRPAFGHSTSSLVEKVQELGIPVPMRTPKKPFPAQIVGFARRVWEDVQST